MRVRFIYLFLFSVYHPPSFAEIYEPELNECTDLILEVNNCTKGKLHIPETCGSEPKSSVSECIEKVISEAPVCHEKLARELLVHFVKTYRNSDIVLCSDQMYDDFLPFKSCWSVAEQVARQIAFLGKDYLTKRGCGYMKTAIFAGARIRNSGDCYEIVEKYVDKMFTRSPCGYTLVPLPDEKMLNQTVKNAQHVIECWLVNTEMPNCKLGISDRAKCINKLNPADVKNLHFKHVLRNVIEVTHTTDHVMCHNEKLHQGFGKHFHCFPALRQIAWLIARKAHGIYTEKGCEALKYRENFIISQQEKECIPLLMEYRKAMDEVVPCVETQTSLGSSLFPPPAFLQMLLLFISVANVIFH